MPIPPGVRPVYNKVILIGRLTRDPELRYTPGGKPVASLRLAVDRSVANAQGERETDFFDVTVWDRQAEIASRYLTKGRLVLCEGRLQTRQYEAQDGSRRTAFEVVATTVRFLPDGRGGVPAEAGAEAGGRAVRPPEPPLGQEFTPDDDDDVPF